MSWRDNLRPGSFRGVPFWTEDADMSGGRRTVTHQYPFRNEPFTEDLGRGARTYSLNAYVAASVRDPDYMPARDALIEALEADGPGELVHPFHGTMTVQCTTFAQGESKTKGGRSFYMVNFVEAGSKQYPSGLDNKPSRMTGLAASGKAAAVRSALGGYRAASMPDFVSDAMRSLLEGLAESVSTASGRLTTAGQSTGVQAADNAFLARLPKAIGNAGETIDLILALIEETAAAIETPYEQYRQFDGTYRGVGKHLANPLPRESVLVMLDIAAYPDGLEPVVGGAAMRLLQRSGQEALGSFIRHAALIEAARLAPFVDWGTYDAALAARDDLMSRLEASAMTADDELFQCLVDLRVLVAETVPPESHQLPSLMALVTPRTLPALLLAYDEYDDASRAEEIVAMNGIRHPGFIPAVTTLRMLSHV